MSELHHIQSIAAQRRIRYNREIHDQMSDRHIRRCDVHEAIMTAKEAIKCGTAHWELNGTQLDGEPLTIIIGVIAESSLILVRIK